MAYNLGVDLGTTFVAAAIAYPKQIEMVSLGDRSVVVPAVVYVREDGELVTGDAAGRRAVSNPDRVGREFKRRLGDPTPVMLGGSPHAVTSLLGSLLRDVIGKVAATEGHQPERVVLTHPANWGPFRRGLFEEVPHLAGLPDVTLVTEPEAAAAHYAATRDLDDGEIIAVYDLGGGTFDATVLCKRSGGVEILGTPEGIERLGGVDFDEAILAHVNVAAGGVLAELDLTDPQTTIALARLRQDCILAKEALSVDTEAVLPVFLPGRHFDVTLTRAEFEGMVRAPIESTIGALARTLRSAQVDARQLSAVLLVGGSSRIPLVARMVSEELGRPTVVDTHPKHAVALGAATLAGMPAENGHAPRSPVIGTSRRELDDAPLPGGAPGRPGGSAPGRPLPATPPVGPDATPGGSERSQPIRADLTQSPAGTSPSSRPDGKSPPEGTQPPARPSPTPRPGRPNGTPPSGLPGGTPTPQPGRPTPAPKPSRPTPTPQPGRPTPTTQSGRPSPTPQPGRPTPTPQTDRPTPTPQSGRPTPTPQTDRPTPTPQSGRPTSTSQPGRPTPTARSGRPSPTPQSGRPTPQAGDPTPTPQSGRPTPTPQSAGPAPQSSRPTPQSSRPTPTPQPSRPTPTPKSGRPTPTPTPQPDKSEAPGGSDQTQGTGGADPAPVAGGQDRTPSAASADLTERPGRPDGTPPGGLGGPRPAGSPDSAQRPDGTSPSVRPAPTPRSGRPDPTQAPVLPGHGAEPPKVDTPTGWQPPMRTDVTPSGGPSTGPQPFGGLPGQFGGQPRPSVPPPATDPWAEQFGRRTPPPAASSRVNWRMIGFGALALVAAVSVAVAAFLVVGQLTSGSEPVAEPVTNPQAVAPPEPAAQVAPSVPVPSLGEPIPAGKTPGFVAISPNGRLAYIANRGANLVTVVDTSINKVIATIPVDAGPPQYVNFSPDGRRVYLSIFNEQRTIAVVGVLDTTTNKVVATVPVRTRPFLSAVTADGRFLWVPNHDSGTVSVIDTANYAVTKEIKVAANPHWIEFSKDGTRAYTANHESNVVSVLDVAAGNVLAEVKVGTSPHSLAVHPTRPLVANVNYDSATVTMIDTNTNQVTATIPVGKNPQEISWAPDGRFCYVANVGDGTVSVINAETNQVTATIPTGNSPTSVGVLPNGKQAYVTNLDSGNLAVLNIGG